MNEERKPNSPFEKFDVFIAESRINGQFNVAEFWKQQSQDRIEARYISPFAIILHEKGVYPQIGKDTWIGHFCIIDGSQGLTIGEDCEISSGAQIYTHSTAKRCALGREKETSPVCIEDNVWIGPNSIVSMGCHVGYRSIIGALSVLDKYTIVPPYTFWAGIPARQKRQLGPLK